MTDEGTQNAPPPQHEAVRSASFTQLFELAKDSFALVSALAVVAGVVLATVFLYGYLNVFDWRLLWLIQYPDILTFALVAIGVVGGSATFLPNAIETVIYTGIARGRPNWLFMSIIGVMVVLLLGLGIYGEYNRPDPHYLHFFYGRFCILIVAFGTVMIARMYHFGAWTNAGAWAWASVSAIFGAYIFGTWLGYSVLETSGRTYDLYLKDSTINDAKLVLMMSHHTIFYKDKSVYVVQTDAVKEIVNSPPLTQK